VSRPLLVTADPDALDDLLRLAATAGVEVDVAADVAAARRCWPSASVVVIGPDLVERCAGARLGRRARVVVLGRDLDDACIWQRAVEVGAEHVVFLPDAEGWLVAELAESVPGEAQEGALVAVIGGRGGAGATTLASALGLTAARAGMAAMLIDADPLGGGLDLVFGGEQADGLRWPDLVETRGRLPAQALSEAVPRFEGLPVLSWDRGQLDDVAVEAVRAVLAAARRASDLVVIDLPRRFDEIGHEVLSAATTTLLVVPAGVRATAAAGRVAARAALLCPDLRLVVRGPAPIGLDPADMARALGLPLTVLRPEPGVEATLERGEPLAERSRSPLRLLCLELIEGLVGSRQGRAA
jgi:secretion/DNA translocation related CpaE-like protein